MPNKPISKFLSAQNSGIATLIERAQHLQKFTTSLQKILRNSGNTELADHVNFANLRDNTAIITTDTPAWLTQLRYQAPAILRKLKQQPGLEGLRKIQLKIQPPSHSPILKPARRAVLSTNSAAILESAANVTDDTELANALRRLSQHNDA